MFREMRRFKQQLSHEECLEILRSQVRGVLSVLGDEGYPYGVPLDFWYCEEDGNLYFHCAKEGHKTDALQACDKASFCVMDEGTAKEGDWALQFRSVIIFGRVSTVEDQDRRLFICRRLSERFTDDQEYIEKEIAGSGPRVQCLCLKIEHMTGKRVTES